MVASALVQLGAAPWKRSDVESMLGPWDGFEGTDTARWELRLDTPTGLLNWDYLFYWSDERYPDRLGGNTIERLGSWAYLHE